jgi:hypothetical protein
MVANLLLLCSAALCGAILPASTPSEPADRFFLACKGVMRVAGDVPPSPIVTEGIVDLAQGSVRGFGVGGSGHIVLVTATRIGFAGDPAARHADLVDGTINRLTGETAIKVRRAAEPERFLIAMDLDCTFRTAPVF